MSGRRIPDEVKDRVREQAGNRCGYCLSPQHLILGFLEIEHIIPIAKGGPDAEENLWLACRLCNYFKATQTTGFDPETGQELPLFNPRRQQWRDHFGWTTDGTKVVGRTPCGRSTIIALQLNNIISVMVRREWGAAGWHPPG